MKIFEKHIEDSINDLMDKSSKAYDDNDNAKSFGYLVQAFEIIPEPRYEYNEAYNYCSYVLDFILEEDYRINEIAEKWLNNLKNIAQRQKCWSGSIDFFEGKTFFRLKDYNKAYDSFQKSIEIGKGFRYFEDEDPKYLDFYKNPEKYKK